MAGPKSSAIKAAKQASPSDNGAAESGTTTAAATTTTKAATKKAPAKTAATSTVKKSAVKTAATATAKTAAKTGSAKKAAGTTSTPAKTTPAKATPAKATPAKATPAKVTPVKTAAKSAATKQTTAKKAATSVPSAGGDTALTGLLAVREGESPWTTEEIAEVREVLATDRARLETEISTVEEEIGHLLREGGEGAGHDQADVGSNTFERDHEMSIARNARDNLVLIEEAIGRIDAGEYGVCESCGKPIGKMRLQAFPRATLCMECKQRSERR